MKIGKLKINSLIILLIICYNLTISSLKAQNKTIETSGDVILIGLPVATLATTFILKDKKGSWQFTKGLLLTEVITFGLKLSVNKQRPDMSNNNSFPSGHTSTVFQSASFLHKRYGLKYSLPAYALAGFTSASRISSDKHDILDVLAGAVIGIGSTYLFTTQYQKKHMNLTLSGSDKYFMLGFTYKF